MARTQPAGAPVRWWRLWSTRWPRTFNEKVRYKMLRDHRQLMVTFADKIAVREHVAAVVGEHVLPVMFHALEEFLVGADGGVPDDYKFFVFHGTCRYISVDRGRFARRTQDFFTPDWTHVPLSGGPPWADPPIARPERLAEMLGLAELLGQGTDFVRVDLYDLPDRVVFGELSSLPAGGDSPFEPESFNLEFGSHWTPPRRYL